MKFRFLTYKIIIILILIFSLNAVFINAETKNVDVNLVISGDGSVDVNNINNENEINNQEVNRDEWNLGSFKEFFIENSNQSIIDRIFAKDVKGESFLQIETIPIKFILLIIAVIFLIFYIVLRIVKHKIKRFKNRKYKIKVKSKSIK